MARIAKLKWKQGSGVVTTVYKNYCFVISWLTNETIFLELQILGEKEEVLQEIHLGMFRSISDAKQTAGNLFPYLR